MSAIYERIAADAERPTKLRDWSQRWAKLKPLAELNGSARTSVEAFCAGKRITVEALEALGARVQVKRGNAIYLAFAGTTLDGQAVSAIKYRPVGGSSHDSDAEQPSTWLRPIVVGRLDSLHWFVAEGETDTARLYDLVGSDAAIVCLPTGARAEFKSEWVAMVPRGATVFLAHDADADGDEGAAKASRRIGGRVVRLRPPVEGCDWCDLGLDRDEFVALVRAALGPADEFRIVTVDEFAAVDEPGANAILGDPDGPLIPDAGDVMAYGDGGTGKTTLFVDCAFHLAAGDDWLGIRVPRPVRVLLIEAEGPRPLFRKKLARKRAAWAGSDLGDRLHVLEHPWARFSFRDGAARELLADRIRELSIDVVVVGPLTSVGMDTGGTIPETRAFLDLVNEVREMSGRPVAVILIHHENKGGKVSGAWEGVGDTLLHIQQQGHGKLRLFVQKARWASEQHQTSLQLAWAQGDGFAPVDAPAPRPERTWDGIEDYVLARGGCIWGEVLDAVPGQTGYLMQRRTEMLKAGVLINAGTGKAFELWHRDDPERPSLDTDLSEGGNDRERPSFRPEDGAREPHLSVFPVRSRERRERETGSPPPSASENDPGRVSLDNEEQGS